MSVVFVAVATPTSPTRDILIDQDVINLSIQCTQAAIFVFLHLIYAMSHLFALHHMISITGTALL